MEAGHERPGGFKITMNRCGPLCSGLIARRLTLLHLEMKYLEMYTVVNHKYHFIKSVDCVYLNFTFVSEFKLYVYRLTLSI